MAVSGKRRSSGRKKAQKSSFDGGLSLEEGMRSWGNEALAVVCFSVAIFVGASVSFNAPGGFFGGASNVLGPLGRVVGTLLYGFFGWCALVPAAWFAWLGVSFWSHELPESVLKIDSKLVRISGIVLAMISACALCSIFWGVDGGGRFGTAFGWPLTKYLNTTGGGFVAGSVLLLSLALALKVSVGSIIGSALRLIGRTLNVTLLVVPGIVVRCVVLASSFVTRGIIRGIAGVFGIQVFAGREEEEELPKPRLRKNKIDRQEDSAVPEEAEGEVEDEEIVDLSSEEDEVTHVVVNRRTTEWDPKKKKGEKGQQFQPEYPDYKLPETSLLTQGETCGTGEDDEELLLKSRQIENKLKDFNILGKVTQVHPGPVITLFEFEPAAGIKVGRIVSFADDLAMSLRASSIRIIAPIPKRGTVGIEVPNRLRDTVRLRDVFESPVFQDSESILTVALGKDTYGEPVVADIATMPHLLMAGATGTGKSVCINAILLSLLYRASPSELGLIMIDPKVLELSSYDGIPHLRVPVVTVPRQAKAVLQWAANEMDRRYRMMQKYGVRNIDGYNRLVAGDKSEEGTGRKKKKAKEEVIELEETKVVEQGTIETEGGREPVKSIASEELHPLPKIVIVIDELADLMLTVGKDVEDLITRLAQKARAAGIHLIVATQRPSVDVITGLIKANFPARLSFQVSSRIDSRTILDSMGAEKLLGKGDMLLTLPTAGPLRRIHGAFVSDAEVKRAVDAVKLNGGPQYDEQILSMCERALEEESSPGGEGGGGADEYDPMYDQVVQFVLEKRVASTSMIQRMFRLGYNRAARIVEKMEREGIVGPMDGAKPRQVLLPTGNDEVG